MGCPHVVVLATLVLTGQAMAEMDTTTTIVPLLPHWNINYLARQETPLLVPTSTSSFNWWPYPPGGMTTSSIVPVTSVPGVPGISSTSDISVTDPNPLTTTPPLNLNTVSSSSSSLSTSSLSIIHITALPPANSTRPSGNLPKLKHSSSFHITYLVPLFAVLGIILGSVTAWFCYGFVTARRGPREREDLLEPGPPYVANPHDAKWEYDEKNLDMESVPLTNDGSPSKYTSHGSHYSHRNRNGSGSWIGRAFSSRISPDDKSFAWPTPGIEEDNPFLVIPSRGLSTRTNITTGKSISVYSPDALSLADNNDEDVDMIPYESLRHKSIRRDILDRLKFGTVRHTKVPLKDAAVTPEDAESSVVRPNQSLKRPRHHQRADSDFHVNDLCNVGKDSSDSEASCKKVSDAETQDDVNQVTQWVEGSGFRIVEEHLDKIRDQVRDGDWGSSIKEHSPTASIQTPRQKRSSPTITPLNGKDKYTALPIRKSPSKGRSPHVTTPKSTPRRQGVHRVDSSVLPKSPPQITSPPLEYRLSFQSPKHIKQPVSGRKNVGTTKKATTTPISARSVKIVNKLHLPTPPRLPAPSTAEGSPYRVKTKLQHEDENLPSMPPRQPSPNHSPSTSQHRPVRPTPIRRGTPAERFIARHGALDKVDQIMSRSWSQRDVNEVEKEVGSPNMFGAQVDSMQERLATVEGH